MSDLRLYDRRPSCLVRFRHGGYSALSPLGQRSVIDFEAARTGTGDIAITSDAPESAKVLPFPGQSERPGRKKNGRAKGRSSGRNKA